MHQFYFERLQVWQEARQLAKDIYITTKDFPVEEKYGITSQIRRATLSISANIAEGMSRSTDKRKAWFINIAFGSTIEVINFLIIAKDFNWVNQDQYDHLRKSLEKISNQLNSLYGRLNGDSEK
ncbi:MAG: four helix bundle protein [Saprospiraceae bacterium]|nr:four helix bundle protein [Saprospiraceae bacterium]